MAGRKCFSTSPMDCPPYAMCFDAESSLILVAGGGGDSKTGVPNKIVSIQCKNGILVESSEFDTATQAVMGLSVAPRGMLAASIDDICRLYSMKEGKLETIQEVVAEWKNMKKEDRQVKKAKFAGKYVYTAGTDGVVRMWLTPGLELLKEIPTFGKEVADFDVSTATRSGAPVLLVASRDECRLYRHHRWSLQPELLATFKCSPPYKFRNCRFSPDLRFVYTAEFQPQHGSLVRKWDTHTMSMVGSTRVRFYRDHHTTMNISQDGQFIALGSAEGELRVISTESLQQIHVSKPHSFFVSDIVFYPPKDPKKDLHIVSCAGDRTVACTTINPRPSRSRLVSLMFLALYVWIASFLWHTASFLFPSYVATFLSFVGPYVDTAVDFAQQIWTASVEPIIMPQIESAAFFIEPYLILMYGSVAPYLELLSYDPRVQTTWTFVQSFYDSIPSFDYVLHRLSEEVFPSLSTHTLLLWQSASSLVQQAAIAGLTLWDKYYPNVEAAWEVYSPVAWDILEFIAQKLLLSAEAIKKYASIYWAIISPTIFQVLERVHVWLSDVYIQAEPVISPYSRVALEYYHHALVILADMLSNAGAHLLPALEIIKEHIKAVTHMIGL